jgi:uncharacterized protein GlcG (DUF336 family)
MMFGQVIGVEARIVGRGNELQTFVVLLCQRPVAGEVDVVEESELQDILREMRTVAGPSAPRGTFETMKTITSAQAQTIVTEALKYARSQNFKPMGVAVLDVRGALMAYVAEDGSSLGRAYVAMGKAGGCIAMGMGARGLVARAAQAPTFVTNLGQLFPHGAIPVPGGVLVKSGDDVVGAVGISGDTSDFDEAAALAGIGAAGLTGDTGA